MDVQRNGVFSPLAPLERYGMYFALLVAWVAMMGSLYFSEVRYFIPCQLCWYQRILMYPLALIIAVGLLRRDTLLPSYTLAFSTIGMFVSTYHYLLQKTNLFSAGAVCQAGIPCNVMYINWLGFITIPFLALIAFILIFMISLVVMTAEAPEEEEEEGKTPWVPVLAVIAIVLLVFTPGFLGNGAEEVTGMISGYLYG